MHRCRRQGCHPATSQGPLPREQREELPGKGQESNEKRRQVQKEQPRGLWNIPTPPRFSSRRLPAPPSPAAALRSSVAAGAVAGSRARGIRAGQAHGTFSFPITCCRAEDDSTAGSLSTEREGWWLRRAALLGTFPGQHECKKSGIRYFIINIITIISFLVVKFGVAETLHSSRSSRSWGRWLVQCCCPGEPGAPHILCLGRGKEMSLGERAAWERTCRGGGDLANPKPGQAQS